VFNTISGTSARTTTKLPGLFEMSDTSDISSPASVDLSVEALPLREGTKAGGIDDSRPPDTPAEERQPQSTIPNQKSVFGENDEHVSRDSTPDYSAEALLTLWDYSGEVADPYELPAFE
jgi:hypothetical protein